MREYFLSHLSHFLCGLLFLSRLGDIVSTYLVSPELKLEANPIAKKLGWSFALASLLVCLIPYYSAPMSIIILVPSLMVSASNTSKIWFARAYGESEYQELLQRMARRSRLSDSLVPNLAAAAFTALIGLILLLLCPDPQKDWGFWFGFGFLAYALAIAFHGSMFLLKLFRKAQSAQEDEGRQKALHEVQ